MKMYVDDMFYGLRYDKGTLFRIAEHKFGITSVFSGDTHLVFRIFEWSDPRIPKNETDGRIEGYMTEPLPGSR